MPRRNSSGCWQDSGRPDNGRGEDDRCSAMHWSLTSVALLIGAVASGLAIVGALVKGFRACVWECLYDPKGPFGSYLKETAAEQAEYRQELAVRLARIEERQDHSGARR